MKARPTSRPMISTSRAASRRRTTQVMLNLANPAAAFRWWQLPADGVGLARMEFVISNHIKVHPMALVHFDALEDEDAQAHDRRSDGQAMRDKTEYFVDRLAARSGEHRRCALSKSRHRAHERFQDQRICQASSADRAFEPKEENPMLGVPGRLALLLAELPRRLCSRMPRHHARCARRWASGMSSS